MRCALFTLIKRQLVDNAIYFAAALLVSFVLIIATISVVLTEDRTYLSPYALALLFAGPVLFCIGSYVVGFIQTRSDQASGVAEILSVLPVSQGRILLARLVVGMLVILTTLGPLTIVGALLWKFLGPPAWLFYGWITDVFLGAVPTTFACYCLGLHADGRVQTFIKGLRALPLILILLLLIIIKGFGSPLLAVLVPFAILCLLHCWKPIPCRIITNITFGLIVLILLAVPLYLSRSFCDGLLIRLLDASAKISPSGLLPMEIENHPNVQDHSEAYSRCWGRNDSIIEPLLGYDWASDLFKEMFSILEPLGITEYFESREHGTRYQYHLDFSEQKTYFAHLDEVAGQLIYRYKYTDSYMDRHPWQWKDADELYIGPEGMSPIGSEKIGRFGSPTIYVGATNRRGWPPPPYIVYDANSQRFFAIDFEMQKVYKGPELYDPSIRPIKIGLSDRSDFLQVEFYSPSGIYSLEDWKGSNYLPVLYESGRIDLLDSKTLELRGPSAYLPRSKTPFGWGSTKPCHLLDYGAHLITVYSNKEQFNADQAGEYLGMVTGSLSRQGMWTSVAVFDKDGHEIKMAHSKRELFNVPGGPALTIMKILFESLHPPALTLTSYFTAYSFEARSTHRALFLMPNSFVAMARDFEGNIFWTILLVLTLMLPALLFSTVLGLRVVRDAAILGLSSNARRLWFLSTLAFGLPAYITYRLTRPKTTLVTCTNCGKSRRLDTETCHQCGSSWHIPEQTPPGWRILDSRF